MTFARWVFAAAAVYGILVLAPGFFLEQQVGSSDPPAVTHPEFYYGFFGSALVWQFVFLVIARDPVRYRTLILVSVLEKVAFFATCLALYATGRLGVSAPFVGGLIDGVWMVLFGAAWWASRPGPAAAPGG